MSPRCARVKSERTFKIRIKRSLPHEIPTQTRFFVLTKGISIVSPRPALPLEVATYDTKQRQRLLVKLGITCYWQTRRNRDSIGEAIPNFAMASGFVMPSSTTVLTAASLVSSE